MSFTQNIPQAYQSPASNQPQILGNFTAMNTIFGQDHFTFSAATNNGKHRIVSFVGNAPSIAIPVTTKGITLIANTSGVLGASANTQTLSYIQNDGVATSAQVQLTGKRVPASIANGLSWLPGSLTPAVDCMGMLICWGMMPLANSGVSGNESADIFFDSVGNTAIFEGAPFSIVLTPLRPVTAPPNGMTPEFVSSTTPPTDTKFRIINMSSAKHDVYWMAIGREKIA